MTIRKALLFVVLLITTVMFLEAAAPKAPKKRKRPKKPKISETELDPLRMVKTFRDATTKVGPNIVFAVDLSPRMLYDWEGTYYDPAIWDKNVDAASAAAAAELGVSAGARYYRRIYAGLKRKPTGSSGSSGKKAKKGKDTPVASATYTASSISVIDELNPEYSTFYLLSRLGLARDGLAQAVEENLWNVRFGMVRMRQGNDPNWPATGNAQPVKLNGGPQKDLKGDLGTKEWKVTYPATTTANISANATGVVLVKAEDNDSSAKVLERLESSFEQPTALRPFGLEDEDFADAPLTNLLRDTKNEVERLMDVDTTTCRPCRNTAVILVVGGGESDKDEDPAKVAQEFAAITAKGVTRRVPIFVIAIGPHASEVKELEAIAAASGGDYYEVYDANEIARIANHVVQAVHQRATEYDAGVYSEFQTVGPVVGTVDLTNAKDINGNALPNTSVTSGSSVILQRNNVVLTSGFALPTFDAMLRAFRVFKPVADADAKDGYRFVKDGTPLWVAHLPGASYVGGNGNNGNGNSGNGNSGKGNSGNGNGNAKGKLIGNSGSGQEAGPNGYTQGKPADRNIYTFIPGTGMVAFTTANAGLLRPYLLQDTEADAAAVIDFVRSQQIGAILTSSPAIMNPPSMDAPDADYNVFKATRSGRRTLVFAGGNNGMLHGIDARLGVEVWAFIPFNHLPKLQTLVDGQGVVYFEYFNDSSPKLADVKIGNQWRTYMVVGQGAGGTFYQAFDVSDAGLAVGATNDSEGALLAAYASPNVIPLKWSFPDFGKFDHTISTDAMPYGDLRANATAVEKSVGETWSAPALGQLVSSSGKWVAIAGSGYLSKEIEKLPARGNAKAGHTLYVLDIGTGSVLDSYDVGDDGGKDNLKNSLTADPAAAGADDRYIERIYIGDTEGNMWRFKLSAAGKLTPAVRIYDAEKEHPIFASAAVTPIGADQYNVYFSTGIDTLGHLKKLDKFVLVGVLDHNSDKLCKKKDKKCERFEVKLEKSDGKGGDERTTSAPVVAGSVVYWTTTTDFPKLPCDETQVTLYALTLGGGPAYDTNGDKKLDSKDKIMFRERLGRATGLFVSDRHLYFGTDNELQVIGDPEDFNYSLGTRAGRLLTWREIQ